jgi:hypothetical protein
MEIPPMNTEEMRKLINLMETVATGKQAISESKNVKSYDDEIDEAFIQKLNENHRRLVAKKKLEESKNGDVIDDAFIQKLNENHKRLVAAKKLMEAKKVDEKWDAKMHTKEKDKGMFKGKTIEELKAAKAKLMKKDTRTEAEQKKVKELTFAIRAKQTNKWGKVSK